MAATTRVLVQEMRAMFKNIHEKIGNCWGGSRNQISALACLKCIKAMHDLKDFQQYGPKSGSSRWFCHEHDAEFSQKMIRLEALAKESGEDVEVLWKQAVEPVLTVENRWKRVCCITCKKASGSLLTGYAA